MATLNDLAVSVIKFGETMERVKREIEAMNDKQPKVWLTVYEAKILATALGYLNGWCKEIYMHDINKLKKRIEKIEQAEGK